MCVADQTYRQVSSVCSILQTHHTLTFMLTPAPIHCLSLTQSQISYRTKSQTNPPLLQLATLSIIQTLFGDTNLVRASGSDICQYQPDVNLG